VTGPRPLYTRAPERNTRHDRRLASPSLAELPAPSHSTHARCLGRFSQTAAVRASPLVIPSRDWPPHRQPSSRHLDIGELILDGHQDSAVKGRECVTLGDMCLAVLSLWERACGWNSQLSAQRVTLLPSLHMRSKVMHAHPPEHARCKRPLFLQAGGRFLPVGFHIRKFQKPGRHSRNWLTPGPWACEAGPVKPHPGLLTGDAEPVPGFFVS
jgi:hypothetical protein